MKKESGEKERERENTFCSNRGSEAPYVFRHFDEFTFCREICERIGAWILIYLDIS